MIGYLTGTALAHDLLLVGGVGYLVSCPTPLTPAPDGTAASPVSLYIVEVINETSHDLYGFTTVAEQSLFRALIKVNGIGPKAALALLTNPGAKEVAAAILAKDHKPLTKAKGVAAKGAQAVINSVNASEDLLLELAGSNASVATPDEEDDVVLALCDFGYTEAHATEAAARARAAHPDADVPGLIRIALAAAS